MKTSLAAAAVGAQPHRDSLATAHGPAAPAICKPFSPATPALTAWHKDRRHWRRDPSMPVPAPANDDPACPHRSRRANSDAGGLAAGFCRMSTPIEFDIHGIRSGTQKVIEMTVNGIVLRYQYSPTPQATGREGSRWPHPCGAFPHPRHALTATRTPSANTISRWDGGDDDRHQQFTLNGNPGFRGVAASLRPHDPRRRRAHRGRRRGVVRRRGCGVRRRSSTPGSPSTRRCSSNRSRSPTRRRTSTPHSSAADAAAAIGIPVRRTSRHPLMRARYQQALGRRPRRRWPTRPPGAPMPTPARRSRRCRRNWRPTRAWSRPRAPTTCRASRSDRRTCGRRRR